MMNFGPLTAKIDWRVWGTPSYFNGYRVLAALLHGTLLVGVGQTLRRSSESENTATNPIDGFEETNRET